MLGPLVAITFVGSFGFGVPLLLGFAAKLDMKERKGS